MGGKVTRAELAKCMSVRKWPDLDFLIKALQVLSEDDQQMGC